MAIFSGKDPYWTAKRGTVQNGLIFHANFSVTQSYPGTGNILYDLSGNGSSGTMTNGANYLSSNGGIINFDGVDDYVNVPNSTLLQQAGPITISCWLKISNNGAYCGLVSKSSSGLNGEFEIGADFRGVTELAWRPGSLTSFSSYFSGYTDTWLFLTITCDGSSVGSSVNAYRNGVFFGTLTTNTVRSASTNAVNIGKRSGAALNSQAQIDDVRIYNRALTASEIQQNYNATRKRFGV